MKKRNLILIGAFFFVALIVYIVFCVLVAKNGGDPLAMDIWARDAAYNTRGNKGNFVYWFFRIITETGNTYWVVVLVLAALFYTRLDSRFVFFGLAILLQVVLNAVFKGMYQRERPIEAMRWMYESSTSFPSGHSTTAGCIYPFIIYVLLTSDHEKKLKYSLIAVASFLLIIVPSSRIVLGMHYLSDCIAGLCLGFMCALAMMALQELARAYNILQTGVIHFKKKS